MRKVAIIGVGQSKFGRRDDVSLPELALEAIEEAINDSGISRKDIQFATVGTVGILCEEIRPEVYITEYAGLSGIGCMKVDAACASGSAAFLAAYSAVASKLADVAIAIGVEKMTEVDTPTAIEVIGRAGSYLWEFHNFGVTFPAYYALYATRHMMEYGTKEEDMALVAVKNHKYGALNPKAHFQREITVDDVLKSRYIAWPLKLFDCCPISDGASAVILASEEKARELKVDTPIWVSGIGVASDTLNINKRPDYVGLYSTVKASREAYKMAKISPNEVEVACVHDCFTIAEIMAYEDLGFCEKGGGAKMIREGQTEIGGRVAVNVDGGLKAKGHPLGATGCSMIYEITNQLREKVEKRQRQAPLRNYIGLVHNVGGSGYHCYVFILKR